MQLGNGVDRFPAADRLKLYRDLAARLREAGDLQHAKELAVRACEADHLDLAAHVLFFDLCCLGQDTCGLDEVLAAIRSFEGEDPLWHYGQAVRLAVLARREAGTMYSWSPEDRTRQFQQALEHLSLARRQRPGWGRPALLAAQLYDRLGRPGTAYSWSGAIENYCQAIDAGETEPATVQRAFELLSQQRGGDWGQTNRRMRALLLNHGRDRRFLAAYAAMLLDRNETHEVRLWLNRLEEAAPDDPLTVELQARWRTLSRSVPD